MPNSETQTRPPEYGAATGSASDVRAIINSRVLSAEATETATIILPSLPVEPGNYRVTFLRSPTWFIAWGRRQNNGVTGVTTNGRNVP